MANRRAADREKGAIAKRPKGAAKHPEVLFEGMEDSREMNEQKEHNIDILLRLRMLRRRLQDVPSLYRALTDAIQEITALRVKVQVLEEAHEGSDNDPR
jgi:hypothetical protein